jgi:hypothetical protein
MLAPSLSKTSDMNLRGDGRSVRMVTRSPNWTIREHLSVPDTSVKFRRSSGVGPNMEMVSNTLPATTATGRPNWWPFTCSKKAMSATCCTWVHTGSISFLGLRKRFLNNWDFVEVSNAEVLQEVAPGQAFQKKGLISCLLLSWQTLVCQWEKCNVTISSLSVQAFLRFKTRSYM